MNEIASLPPQDIPDVYRANMQLLLVHLINSLIVTIPREADLAKAYEEGTDEECLFVSRLALMLGTYLKSYLPFFDQPDGTIAHEAVVIESLIYMIRVTSVEDEDIFKTCLEFWTQFTKDLYNAEVLWKTSGSGVQSGSSGGTPSNAMNLGRAKHIIFEGVLHNLRLLMIDHMAKPEEVIIVEDDNGEIVRGIAR